MLEEHHNYLCNRFPFLGKDDTRAADNSLSCDVVLKLLNPLYNGDCHVTCDRFFTSLNLAKSLKDKKISFLGTVHQNRRKLSAEAAQKQELYKTKLFNEWSKSGASLIAYHLFSTLHRDVSILENHSFKCSVFRPHHTTTWVIWRGRTPNSFLGTEFYRVVSRCFLQPTQQAGRKFPVFLTRHHLETVSGGVPCLREHGLTRDWTLDNDFTVRHTNR